MKKKLFFIINPVSGVGRQKKVEKLLDEVLDRTAIDYEIRYTKSAGHATELSAEAVAANFDAVVAVGGDGSVNEAGRSLINSNTALAILPAGSGNGLARHLGIPMDLKRAMKVVQGMKTTRIDTGSFNDRPFFGMSGVGFDAHIGYEFSRFGKRGFSSYIKVFLREFPKYKAQEIEITIDGKTIVRKALLVSVANGSQYGNNAFIAPQADVTDGVLDICILKEFPLLSVASLARRLFNRTMNRSKYMEALRGKDIHIRQSGETGHTDGEPFIAGKEVFIKVNPLSLKVVVP